MATERVTKTEPGLQPIGKALRGAQDRLLRASGGREDPKPPGGVDLRRWRRYARTGASTYGFLKRSGVPPRYLDGSIEGDLVPAAAATFLGTWREGGGLILAGPPGSGKTAAAVYLLARIYWASEVEVEEVRGEFLPRWAAPSILFEKVRRLYAAVFERDRSRLRAAAKAEILVLDDWGSAYEHSWPLAELDGLVDDRWERKLATIVTTNLAGTREQGGAFAFESTAERAFSRLCGDPGPGLVVLDREDLRRRR